LAGAVEAGLQEVEAVRAAGQEELLKSRAEQVGFEFCASLWVLC
jgi:hypothetical protein